MAPHFTYPATGSAQALHRHAKPRLCGGESGRAPYLILWGPGSGTGAEGAGLVGRSPSRGCPAPQSRPSKPAEAKTQPNPKNKHGINRHKK